jgi:hypothetical protein
MQEGGCSVLLRAHPSWLCLWDDGCGLSHLVYVSMSSEASLQSVEPSDSGDRPPLSRTQGTRAPQLQVAQQ